MQQMQELKLGNLVLVIFLLFFLNISILSEAQPLPPPKQDGFVYKKSPVDADAIVIEAFLDPVCSDSKDTWEPLKQVIEHYGNRIHLVIHLFPLPYHDNAYAASRALHIVNAHNSSATIQLLDSFFKYQDGFYNAKTHQLSRDVVVRLIASFAAKVLGANYYTTIESGFWDIQSDAKTRVSFKYGCTRGVYGTPFFFVNGFALPNAGSPIYYDEWRKVIDPLTKGIMK